MATPSVPASYVFTCRMLPIGAGLYIFRFATKLEANQTVCIALQGTPGTDVELFGGLGVEASTLKRLGDTVIVKCSSTNGQLLITQYSPQGQPPVTVDLRVDRIDTSEAIIRNTSANTAVPAVAPAATPPLSGRSTGKAVAAKKSATSASGSKVTSKKSRSTK